LAQCLDARLVRVAALVMKATIPDIRMPASLCANRTLHAAFGNSHDLRN